MDVIVIGLGIFAIVATLMPFIKTEAWWVRGFDYPKPQIASICVVAVGLWLAIGLRSLTTFTLLFTVALAAAAAWNLFLIAPFTPLWPKHVKDAKGRPDGDLVSTMVMNVEMENEQHDRVLEIVDRYDPDVLFIAETDARWCRALAPLRERYPHVIEQPQENYYGLSFYTRLDVEAAEVRFVLKDDTPSIRAVLRSRAGRRFLFFGLHPEPPLVGKDTHERDAELMIVAEELQGQDTPAIVGGDLNDVAWSHTTRLFRRISGLLDPRIGRGLFASFHARYPFARWPLDHLFNSAHFTVERLGLCDSVGSDHFPVHATLCLAPHDERQDPEERYEGDEEEAKRIIENTRQRMARTAT